ncbi:hypothetical protein A3D11_01955 [Candidatus Peribacteria bacterium RIFCSPHIGHO2_02_FULL_49_16]|nr:MAG: hypothetical protein A2880_01065 [Candidatus Peribacteria bacterium RIFCSPHIGHO2_01_FULL_49_38]OGJ58680.1 MAG: hypothetical protein A3D11_01955 [Candidatus Peribacteria bacterium RIFCSPHIGHO2_02_FULL_49_16]
MYLFLFFLLFSSTEAEAASLPPHILSRAQWGADEELLFSRKRETYEQDRIESDEDRPAEDIAPSNRITDCRRWQEEHPEEFVVAQTTRRDEADRLYRWPLQYASDVRMIVIHHTALKIGDDERSPKERVQALYEYHADGKGWGDIGYHYIVDEEGNIYEGRHGGDRVVGGHAYCWNTGTVGIALLGNFEIEKPTQAQIKSLQWLLDHLVKKYDIHVNRSVRFHGKDLPPIVGHDDLMATACPGHYMDAVLSQVRKNVWTGHLTASVTFPGNIAKKRRTSERARARLMASPIIDRRVLVEQSRRRQTFFSPLIPQVSRAQDSSNEQTAIMHTPHIRETREPEQSTVQGIAREPEQTSIRIHLTTKHNPLTILLPITTRINEESPLGGMLTFTQSGNACKAQIRHKTIRDAVIRIDPGNGILTLQNGEGTRRYRGILECRIMNGEITLINELPIEQYLWGLAEEPDSEPFEKQRAFSIAARTYAVHYLQKQFRKFPGKPYDGSDDPAIFQSYGGADFEARNPQWVRAVQSTQHHILIKNDVPIRAAYSSSNDGRTRSPKEVGWITFPFAEIFASKPDPWCTGQDNRGHGVGMSGCGAEGQANEGKKAEEILEYYYPGTLLGK